MQKPSHSPTQYQFDLSVVIVSFNTLGVLRECLVSLYRDVGSLRVEVFVIDNASVDGSPDMVEREFPQVVLIRSAINLGFGNANNIAFARARGRYVIMLNSDAYLTEGTLERSVAHMDADTRIGFGGGRLVGRDGSKQAAARMFPTVLDELIILSGLAARFPRSRFFGRIDRTWADDGEAAEVDWVPGAYAIIRAEALAEIGHFDPCYFLYYDEVDFCKRLKPKGYTVWYWPDIRVVHIGGESSRKVTTLEFSESGSQLTLWRMRSTLMYYRKFHGPQARLIMLVEMGWHWMQSKRRGWSKDPNRRAMGRADRVIASTMRQAWKDTKGGRVSPTQPW